MKLSDILLLSLFFVMGSMIFAIKQMQKANRPAETPVPVPAIKPVLPKAQAATPELRLQLSTPETAGSYGRLSLDQFLARSEPEVTLRDTAPRDAVQKLPQQTQEAAPQRPAQTPPRLEPIETHKAEPINLPTLDRHEEAMFMDRVALMAEASPIQPGARDCGHANSKVRSVGMERQLTDRTSIGVEYVYKDGCYKNAIAPLRSLAMPSDDGVNLRVNMRF